MPDNEVDDQFREIMRGLAQDRPDIRETMELIAPSFDQDAPDLHAGYFGLSAEDLLRDEEIEQEPEIDS